jgi:hypothetical protein
VTLQPSELVVGPIPFVGTLDRFEYEVTAAIIVRVCQRRGAWGPVTPKYVNLLIREDLAKDPKHPLWTSPFYRIDPDGLVGKGFAQWVGDGRASLELTPLAIERIAAKWRKA